MANSRLRLPHFTGTAAPSELATCYTDASPRRNVAGWYRTIARRATPAAYIIPAFAVYALFVLWPLLRLGVLSLERWDGFTPPAYVGLDNYAALWSDPGFVTEVQHSLLWLGVTLTVPVVLGLGLALLLRAVSPRLRAALRALLLVPLLLPTVLIAVAWRLFYNPLSGPLTNALHAFRLDGLAGDWLGDPRLALPALLVVACWASFGLSMLLSEAALGRISADVLAAAQLDGAGALARFRWITLPALCGILPLAIVATAGCAVPSYDLVLLMTNGGPGYATTTLALDAYGRAFGAGQVGAGAALACLQSLIGLAFALIALLVARGHERAEPENVSISRTARAHPRGKLSADLSALALTAIMLSPLLWLAALALRPVAGMSAWTTLRANLELVWVQGFGGAIATGLGIAVVVAAVAAALAIPAGFALATSRSRLLHGLAGLLLALGLFQPVAVLIIPLFRELLALDLLDTAQGLALPQVARVVPLAVLLVWIAMRSLPAGVLEAAATDGAAPRQVLWTIALPLTLPVVVVVLLWSFLVSWNDYLLPTVVQDAGLQTVPLALAHFVGRFDTEYGLLATGALLALLPLLALYGGLYRVLSRGMRSLGSGM